MKGSFTEGLSLIPYIEEKLEEYGSYIDRHRILVFNYKFATLYFGSGNYEKSIDYLQKIINGQVDLRNDLQCYSRLLHLMAHYELGNTDIMEYLIKSVYRFMARMQKLTAMEEAIFKFLRNSFHIPQHRMKPELEKFLEKIKKFEKDRFETRAFAYLDILSWVEGKVQGKSMGKIIEGKYLASKHR
jgi:tetratricopeptide (TPR) repeat protein